MYVQKMAKILTLIPAICENADLFRRVFALDKIEAIVTKNPDAVREEMLFDGQSPLICAIRKKWWKVAKLLLKHDAPLVVEYTFNGVERSISTLVEVCALGKLSLAKAILSKDYGLLNRADSSGRTPLMAAAASGNCDLCKHLINMCAKVTAEILMISAPHFEVFKMFYEMYVMTSMIAINHKQMMEVFRTCKPKHVKKITDMYLEKNISDRAAAYAFIAQAPNVPTRA